MKGGENMSKKSKLAIGAFVLALGFITTATSVADKSTRDKSMWGYTNGASVRDKSMWG